MTDIRGPRLADLPNHVVDALRVAVDGPELYQVGTVVLASYTFTPYALSGLSVALADPAAGQVRGASTVTVPVADEKGQREQAQRTVTVYGPGDVVGIDPTQVVRRYPAPGTTTAEETFLVHVEFDRPELPWLFSAARPSDTMRPWLALVVLDAAHATLSPGLEGLPQRVHTRLGELPPLDAAHQWAHAQALGGAAPIDVRMSPAWSAANLSRLVSPRILTDGTDYLACVVPTTDVGRRAGLGETGGSLGPAWTRATDGSDLDTGIDLPAYLSWTFRTGPDGDFARLARRLHAVAAPWQVGRRILDTGRPGRPLQPLAADEPGRHQVIKCALFSPAAAPPDAPAEDQQWTAARTAELAAVLNRSAGPAEVDLPRVGPRSYARLQRGEPTVGTDSGQDWYPTLNLRPADRVVAGLGTRVVRRDQEQLMQAAWAQLGDVQRANAEIRRAQLARYAADRLLARFAGVTDGRLLALTRPVHPRISVDGNPLTVSGQVRRSAFAPAALSGGFRRTLRPGGPLARRVAAPQRPQLARILAGGGAGAVTQPRDFTRPYAEPDGIVGWSDRALTSVRPGVAAAVLGVPEAQVPATLASRNTLLTERPTLAQFVTEPRRWGAPTPAFDLSGALLGVLARVIETAAPSRPGAAVTVARSVSSLLAGAALSRVPGAERLGERALALAGRSGAGSIAAGPLIPPPTAALDAPIRRTVPVPVSGAVRGGVTGAIRGGIGVGVGGPISPGRPGPVPPPAGPEPADATTRLDLLGGSPGRRLAELVGSARLVPIDRLRAGVGDLLADGALDLPVTPARTALVVDRTSLLQRLAPGRTVTDQLLGRLQLPTHVAPDWFADRRVQPIMAAPVFVRDMYEALDHYDRDWLIPGLGTLPADDCVSLLSTNDRFVEAFLIGLSDEMGRELLWRGYPTDQRGTYFRRFWRSDSDELVGSIHAWTPTPLGAHVTMGGSVTDGRVVLLVRGEIVRRYPDLITIAARPTGSDAQGRPLLPQDDSDPARVAPILFSAFLPSDTMLVGFDLTVARARAEGWWFLIGEHPTAPRFERSGADPTPATAPQFADLVGDGGAVAEATLHDPIRVAFPATHFC